MTFVQACKVFTIPAKYATWQMVRDLYKEMARTAHPDAGGDRADWDTLQEAYQALRLGFSVPTTCKTCDGAKRVMTKGFKLVDCPGCDGKGFHEPQYKGQGSL